MQDESGLLRQRLEAVLLAAPGPASLEQLATALQVGPNRIAAALAELEAVYRDHGLRLQRHHGRAQLTTAPEFAQDVERFLQLDSRTRLSRAALEVLAIIGYRQPVTRPVIDYIRGVNSDASLKTLLRHGLIEEIGRSEGPGRPILYGTSPEFLQHFGLNSLDELPPLATDSQVEA
jgi:segregation and condensation protein B